VLPPTGSVAAFAVLETTDIHTNVRSYDYFKLAEDKSIGIERTSTLINQARQEIPNNVLVDNGDTIQGTVLADYQALVQPVACAASLAVYKAMNTMGFDVGGIGNHEFNYGLEFLARVTHTPFDVAGVDTSGAAGCQGPLFPQVNSNVFSVKTGKTLFQPSVVITRTIAATTTDGKAVSGKLRVGFLDFTPPPILNWDKASLEGKVFTKGVQEVAAPLIQDLRAQGADLVVAIIHGGLDNATYAPGLENQAWYLAQVPGIDAMLMGHSHQIFPSATSKVA
jgi:2',3'-cyclic-nucleotide 2'-phosphodiesterase/3'-nucleotidase